MNGLAEEAFMNHLHEKGNERDEGQVHYSLNQNQINRRKLVCLQVGIDKSPQPDQACRQHQNRQPEEHAEDNQIDCGPGILRFQPFRFHKRVR